MTEVETLCQTEKMTGVVKESERDVGPGKDLPRENAPERGRPDERGRGRLGDPGVLFLVTRFSFPSFHWTAVAVI